MFKWFKHKKRIPTYWPLVQLEIERESYPWKQELADKQVERAAIREAFDLYYQWLADDITWKDKKFGLYIAKPQIFTIIEYPGQHSKWTDGAYEKFKYEKFNELKAMHESF